MIDDKDIKTQEDFFKVNSKKLDALLNATENDLEKAEHSILRRTNDRYRKIIFDAQVYANTGAGTVVKVIDMASRDFLSRGIDCIEYNDGKRMNIASYVEMAVRTANKRAVNVSEGEIRKQRGWHLVRISKYGQCSEICFPWQGRIYVDDVYSGGTKEESKQTGYPLLSKAIEGGLFHPNCRHRSTTYFPDLQEDKNNKKFDGKKENKDNAVASKKLDREIQKQRRIEKGSLDEENIQEAMKRHSKLKRVENLLQHEVISKKSLNEKSFTPKSVEFSSLFGLTTEDEIKLNEIHKAANDFMKLNEKEISFVYSLESHNILSMDIGGANEVFLSKKTMRIIKNSQPNSLYLVHVHP